MTPLEHRREPRLPLTLSVLLTASGGYAIPARLRNVSRHGLFVEAEAPVPRNALLHVELTLPSLAGQSRFLLPVYAVHTTERGAGLVLTPGNPEAAEVLGRLVKSAAGGRIRLRRLSAG